jgi:predicted enzyme related to lactoylglutathione lyase
VPGRIVHFELVGADADCASGFWDGLFDWNVGGSDPEGNAFHLWQGDETAA